MINLKKFTKSNLMSIIKLSVRKDQKNWLHQIQYLSLKHIIQIQHGSEQYFMMISLSDL